MENNGYYTGKHSTFMLPPVNYQIQYDSFSDYQPHQTSNQIQQQQQQQQQQQHHHQQLPHQVQTTHQQHHDIQSTISVKLDTINKSPSQKNDEIQACSGGYTGNNSTTSTNDFHGNLYHYNKNLDNSDGIAAYNQTSVVSNYSDFDHIGGTSIGQKSLSSFLIPQQQQQHHHQQQQQSHQPHNPQQSQQIQQPHIQHPPTAAIIPQAIGNVQNDIGNQQSKVLSTFDQRTSTKCYNGKATTAAAATNPPHGYQHQQSGYKDSEMAFNFNKLPPIPHTYHHVYPSYEKYNLQSRPTSHHKPYDDNPTNSRPYVCQSIPMATNHKPTSQSELYCSSSATTEQHNRFSNRNFLFPNSAFTTPANGYFTPMYHRSNNVHRNLSLPPPLQPAIDDSANYYHNNNLLSRSGTYNRSQMAFQQTHYPYARSHHPIQIPKLQSKTDIDIMSGLSEDIYHRPYGYDHHYDEFPFSQVPPGVTHYPTKSSKVIYAPYSSNTMNSYPPSAATHQQPLSNAQHQQQQQQHHNIQPQPQQQQQHHQSVIQNQVHSSNDYSRFACSNVQAASVNCSNKVYLQDQYPYATHPHMAYSHGATEVAPTELPKYNQIYEKQTTSSTVALDDIEEQITGSKILKTREIAANKDQFFFNYNANNNSYQQLRGSAEQEASKNQSIRDYLATWNDDEEEEGEAVSGKKTHPRRIAAVDVMSRSCGQSKLETDGAVNVPTTKIHFGIKVDNGGVPTKNLPDIIIDIEKPKVVGGDDSYSAATDKLYVLESIDVPLSDLNKYKHLSVVNKLPDNIVQIDRRKGDSLDDVEETLKLIEKCEERVRLHKSDFELNAKFDSEDCVSPVRGNFRSDVGLIEDTTLNDPLGIHEIDADRQTVPAPSTTIEPDEENPSNADDKTADNGQDGIDDIDDETETLNDCDGEVVRYKCVQKKVSTNGDELIHSDVSIPKLKIKILRRKRSKSFRNRKTKSSSDSFDSNDEIKSMRLDEPPSRIKTLKLLCLDVVNTNSFRKYLISMKENESQNVFQYSGQTSIENNIECSDESSKKDGECISEPVDVQTMHSDLIDSKNCNHTPTPAEHAISDDEFSSNISNTNGVDDPINNLTPSGYDCFPHHDNATDNSVNDPTLSEFKFHTLSVGDDFSDPHFETNFESIHNMNLDADLRSVPIKSVDTNDEIHQFFPLNEKTIETVSGNATDIDENECCNNVTGNAKKTEQNVERDDDKSIENFIDSQSVASFIDNFDKTQSVQSNRVEVSELMESFDEFEELIGSNEMTSTNNSSENIVVASAATSTNFKESETLLPIESKFELNVADCMTNVFKTEPLQSDYTGSSSSSSSCSSSDDSNDSDFQNETKISEAQRQADPPSVTDVNTVDNTVRSSNTSCSSSDESEDDKSSEQTKNPSETHTDSDGFNTKSSCTESDEKEPKVKIENEEVYSRPDDRRRHSSDNEYKSSSSSGSSSDSSDGSSSDSDDDGMERKLPEEHLPFVLPIIKTEEETHPYSDTTDESSMESCDEAESETAMKDTPLRDKESFKSNSSSEASEDECAAQSSIEPVLTENDEPCEEEEEDKKSCSSNSSSGRSENHDSLSDSVTESETCTDSMATPVSLARQNSDTNSDARSVQENVDIHSNNVPHEKNVAEDFIKNEPTNDDSEAFTSSSDNSDDEYVKLSPLNSNLLDESSRQLSQSKKQILSSDSYSTSSSASSSQSSSSDEYSSDDDDDVVGTKSQLTEREIYNNVTIESTESQPLKPMKTEVEDAMKEDLLINQEDNHVEEPCPNEVEVEIVQNLECDLSLDAVCNNQVESENSVEVTNHSDDHSSTDYVDELLENVDGNVGKEHHNNSELLMNEISSEIKESNSMDSIEQMNFDSNKLHDNDVINCSANDDEKSATSNVFSEIEITQDVDVERSREFSEKVNESIDSNSEQNVTVVEEVNLKSPIEFDRSAESNTENQVDSQNFEDEIKDKCENLESSSGRDEHNSDTTTQIDAIDSRMSLQSSEPIKSDSRITTPNDISSNDLCDNEPLNDTLVVRTNESELSNGLCDIDEPEEVKDNNITEDETIKTFETSCCNEEEDKEEHAEETEPNESLLNFGIKTDVSVSERLTETERVDFESTNENSTEVENNDSAQIDNVNPSPTAPPKDLIYPVLDIPVKLIPLPGETFNTRLYQKLIDNSEIFPSRQTDEIDNVDDLYLNIPVELIPLPGETIDETSSHFVEFKRKCFENQRNATELNQPTVVVGALNTLSDRNQVGTDEVSQSEIERSNLSESVNEATLVINVSVPPSLKVLCEKILGVAGLHYDDDDDEIATSIDPDNDNISYLYIVNDDDDFWNCSNESSSPLIVCYDGDLDDDVFVDSNLNDATEVSEIPAHNPENCSLTSQSVDSFTIDSHDIQYEEIVPVNRTMYKLETFKRYLQSKYIQKPNYIQIHCIKKILKKYSNYQRYRKRYVQTTNAVQKCMKMQNFKNLFKHPKNNETLPLPMAADRFTVNDNGHDRDHVPSKNDVLRSNCDINKSKLLLLTCNNINNNNNNSKSKRNLNSTQRNHKLNESRVSAISSYVSEMTTKNHLKESRAFAKEIITKKRSAKSHAKVTTKPIVETPKASSQSNQIAMSKRKAISDSIAESMITRTNKKRKLSFDDTLLGINRIYKQSSVSVDCDRVETKSSSVGNKLKERSISCTNSNILNNSKDKVKRLIIPKSKIFDGPSVSMINKLNPLVLLPYVKLVRNPFIDNLSKSYGKSTLKSVNLKHNSK